MAARAFPPDDPTDAISGVMERAFDRVYGEAWTRRQVSDALVMGNCRHALCDERGRITPAVPDRCAGFYLSRTVADEEELLLFAVDPALRGRGIGLQLLQHFIEDARRRSVKKLFLEMREGNSAGRLYRRCGFEEAGRRPAYYRGNDGVRRDALSYVLALD